MSGQSHAVTPSSGIEGLVSRQVTGGMDAGVGGGGGGGGGGSAPARDANGPAGNAPNAPNASNPLTAPNAANANMCTPEDAQRQADAALNQCRVDINQTVNAPLAPPAAAGPVCAMELSSRPLNEALAAMMRAEGMSQSQINNVWTAVQRRVAGSFGEFYDLIGAVQRCVGLLLDMAETIDRGGPTLAPVSAGLRTAATTLLNDAIPRLHEQIKQKITNAAVEAIQDALGRCLPCLPDQVAAAVNGVLPQQTFGAVDLTSGTTREVRFRVTSQFANYRTAVQNALQAVAGTTFRPFITADANGLHMTMLTDADHTARMAGAGTTLDAGHLHMDGGNAADVQSMAWDVYQMQATSNNGAALVDNLVQGRGQNFDVVMHAVNNSSTVSYDAFISNEVDLADIHAERHVALPNSSDHPQAQESVYAHFLHERQYDATHSGTNMTTIATTARTLETQRVQLRADHDALPARVMNALDTGVQPTPPLNAAETAQATAWANRARTWQTAQTANQAAFDARFNAAHSYAIDQENAYNRERGFNDQRPH
jgi:hypothetical protein